MYIKITNSMMNPRLAYFMSFIYENYIYEDFDCLTKLGRFMIIPAWYVKSFFTWIISFICFPVVLLHIFFKTNEEWLEFVENINKKIAEGMAENKKAD